jgi:hypothetical protein
MFDPLQRLAGTINLDKSHEIEALMATFTHLQDRGHTVIFAHHNNKSNSTGGDAYAMSSSQRIGADADSICGLYHLKEVMRPDDNPDGVKERNFVWTLRSGHAESGSIRTRPLPGTNRAIVEFGAAITAIPAAPTPTTSPSGAPLPGIK